MNLFTLLKKVADQKASDLFISYNAMPMIKKEGRMYPVYEQVLDMETNHELIYSILNDNDIKQYESSFELNKSLIVNGVGRFRINIFRQRGEPALVARFIKNIIPTIEELQLPEVLKDLIMEDHGLILLVGSTGTGKSTTLAAMIDYRNKLRTGHILTIEDPIEFIYTNRKSLVNQREVGLDTLSYEEALKNALRESPNVILIGEIRDRKTMQQAITYAETGHLCLATLHANNANQAIERILNFFPEESHRQLLQDLSLNLKAVVAQRLLFGIHDKRVAAVELMINTPYISELIEKGKVTELKEAMEKSSGRINKTFDQALFDLVIENKVTSKEALRHADSVNNLSLRLRTENPSSSGRYPIKSEYTIKKNAPFDHYETYSIKTIPSKRFHDSDLEKKITYGIQYALNNKGLQENEQNPDIIVQFIYGIKSTSGLKLEPIEDEARSFASYVPETEKHYMVVINVVDSRSDESVYRITASRHSDDLKETKEQIAYEFVDLLRSLPVGSEHD